MRERNMLNHLRTAAGRSFALFVLFMFVGVVGNWVLSDPTYNPATPYYLTPFTTRIAVAAAGGSFFLQLLGILFPSLMARFIGALEVFSGDKK